MTVQVVAQGHGAQRAVAALTGTPGLVTATRVRQEASGDKDVVLVLTVIATIISAAGGAAQIADSILGWRDRLREHPAPPPAEPPLSVLVVVGDTRARLDDLTHGELLLLAAAALEDDAGREG